MILIWRLIILTLVYLLTTPAPIAAQTSSDWYMAGANPQRTSWVASTPENQTEIKGTLYPEWHLPLEPYINYKVQLIIVNDIIYLSTAGGLYAFSTNDTNGNNLGGDLLWVFPTEIPLGNSPTVIDNRLYIGGYDKKVYALEASPDLSLLPTDPATGYRINNRLIWTFDPQPHINLPAAGFETNPLIINGLVYMGDRNGYLYALNQQTGSLVWKFKAGGPILFSPAYLNDTVYFAANDSFAYALNATTGTLKWKSEKLPGAGFHSYWPVVYQDNLTTKNYVIFAGAINYVTEGAGLGAPGYHYTTWELSELFPNYKTDPQGTLIGPLGNEPGNWINGTLTLNAGQPTVTQNGETTPLTEYFESPTQTESQADPFGLNRKRHKPWKRTYLVLNASTGQEFTFDSDKDGQAEYAPIAWVGTHSGNRYPPLVGYDNVLYQPNNNISNNWIAQGGISGWKFGTPYISLVTGDTQSFYGAVDEPLAYSGAGTLIYHAVHDDLVAGSFDLSRPYGSGNRSWLYFNYNLHTILPGYNQYFGPDTVGIFGNNNGLYRKHGIQNPPIPYKGKVYLHKGNTLIAFSPQNTKHQLPKVITIPTKKPITSPTNEALKAKLVEEINKIITAGHLRPGYHSSALYEGHLGSVSSGYLTHYFNNTTDTILTLISALPHLPPALAQQTREYLISEFTQYKPFIYAHNGWASGTNRETFDILEEIKPKITAFKPLTYSHFSRNGQLLWEGIPPHVSYGVYKYAVEFGNTSELYQELVNRRVLKAVPANELLIAYPQVFNQFIAGYHGFFELGKLAGVPEDQIYIPSTSISVKQELKRLLDLRISSYTKDSAHDYYANRGNHDIALNVSANFLYLTPLLADRLRQNNLPAVEATFNEYNQVASGWFVSKYDATFQEGSLDHLLNPFALFQAKAHILKTPKEELVKYLDVPAFERGDLFYIQNLVAAIEAPAAGDFNPDLNSDSWVDFADYSLLLKDFNSLFSIFDFNRVASFFGRIFSF